MVSNNQILDNKVVLKLQAKDFAELMKKYWIANDRKDKFKLMDV